MKKAVFIIAQKMFRDEEYKEPKDILENAGVKKLDDARRQVHLEGFTTGVARKENARLPMQHIPHVEQLLGVIAVHLGGNLVDQIGAEINGDQHHADEQQLPGGEGDLRALQPTPDPIPQASEPARRGSPESSHEAG